MANGWIKRIVFFECNQAKDIFSYTEGDIISLHKEEYRIYFHKIQDRRAVDGLYVNLKPFDEEGALKSVAKLLCGSTAWGMTLSFRYFRDLLKLLAIIHFLISFMEGPQE